MMMLFLWGTFLRLVEQGHDVHVAYQVSGNIAVHDVDAWRYAQFLGDYADAMGIKSDVLTDTVAEISNFIKNKDHNDVDPILYVN